jgi:hypothetical protein
MDGFLWYKVYMSDIQLVYFSILVLILLFIVKTLFFDRGDYADTEEREMDKNQWLGDI